MNSWFSMWHVTLVDLQISAKAVFDNFAHFITASTLLYQTVLPALNSKSSELKQSKDKPGGPLQEQAIQ
jgi:hypothetical protein